MTNYETIKSILEAGHLCGVQRKNKKWRIYSSIDKDDELRSGCEQNYLENANDGLGQYHLSKEQINAVEIIKFKPIPRPIKLFKVGDKVDIMENARECGDYESWDKQKKEMVGKKGFEIRRIYNCWNGISYDIEEDDFPHHTLSPHIENTPAEEEEEMSELQKILCSILDHLGNKNNKISLDDIAHKIYQLKK
jgi:hypothetical protein